MDSHAGTAAVVMVRPHCFTPNPETAADNSFQGTAAADAAQAIVAAAWLEAEGVRVHLFDDDGSHGPLLAMPARAEVSLHLTPRR